MELLALAALALITGFAAWLSRPARALLAAVAFALWGLVLLAWSLVALAVAVALWPSSLLLYVGPALVLALALVWWGFGAVLGAWMRNRRPRTPVEGLETQQAP